MDRLWKREFDHPLRKGEGGRWVDPAPRKRKGASCVDPPALRGRGYMDGAMQSVGRSFDRSPRQREGGG